ncbi:MAG: hypothetical protein ACOH2A_14305 [Sphingobacteriaceae bacterium]
MTNKTSQHILNTSATLLGFCLFVITSLHSSNYSATSVIDEFTSAVSLVLIFSCLFSFYSIQTVNVNRIRRTETIAEYLFGCALLGILIIILLLLFNIIN